MRGRNKNGGVQPNARKVMGQVMMMVGMTDPRNIKIEAVCSSLSLAAQTFSYIQLIWL